MNNSLIKQLDNNLLNSYTLTVPSYLVTGDLLPDLIPGNYKVKVAIYDGAINLGNGMPWFMG